MSQTIALYAKAPQVSLADVMRDVQERELNKYRINEARRQDQLGEMDTRQRLDQGQALDRYRVRAKDNDPKAIEELDAYPEMAKKLHEALDGMSPEQYREATVKAQAFAQAAKRVSSFPEGSAEQEEAWQVEINKLYTAGLIDEQYRDLWIQSGPNTEIINEALDVGKWTEIYVGKTATDRARAEQIGVRANNDTRLTDARIGTEKTRAGLNEGRVEDIGIDNERADRKTDATIEQGDRRVGVAEQNAESLDNYRTNNLTRQQKKDEWNVEDDKADNVRADRDTDSKIATRGTKGAAKTPDGKPVGEGGSDLSANEYGRRIRNIEAIIERRREKEFLSDDQVRQLERDLRRKYRIPDQIPSISGLDPAGGKGAGAGGKENFSKPPAMSDRVIGKVYMTPKGPMEWTEYGWRPATNG